MRRARLVPDGDGLHLEPWGDARLARRTLARQARDGAFPTAFRRRLLAA
jgi:hypothetical protein